MRRKRHLKCGQEESTVQFKFARQVSRQQVAELWELRSRHEPFVEILGAKPLVGHQPVLVIPGDSLDGISVIATDFTSTRREISRFGRTLTLSLAVPLEPLLGVLEIVVAEIVGIAGPR